MIPRDYITEWRAAAPWIEDFQVEQDLVISRALVEIFQDPYLAGVLAFRGGTALYKLYLQPAARYSEDIDLVQVNAGQAGKTLDALRSVLDPWLGTPRWKQTEGRITFVYRFESEDSPPIALKLKVEINTREHFAVYDYARVPFQVTSRWFNGDCEVVTFDLDELLATKLRALYQRKKGRDLFELATALAHMDVSPERIVAAFCEYMVHGGHHVTRASFEANLEAKLQDPVFVADMGPLLTRDYDWDIQKAADRVSAALMARLPDKI